VDSERVRYYRRMNRCERARGFNGRKSCRSMSRVFAMASKSWIESDSAGGVERSSGVGEFSRRASMDRVAVLVCRVAVMVRRGSGYCILKQRAEDRVRCGGAEKLWQGRNEKSGTSVSKIDRR
jgi:hypothetical protein